MFVNPPVSQLNSWYLILFTYWQFEPWAWCLRLCNHFWMEYYDFKVFSRGLWLICTINTCIPVLQNWDLPLMFQTPWLLPKLLDFMKEVFIRWALTLSYFWPAVSKTRSTHLWSKPKRFFMIPREKNWKFGIFRVNFPNRDPNQWWLTWPDPSNKKLTRPNPGQKILTWTHY